MFLKPVHAHDKEFRLLHDEETVVGRKECHVLINGDPSISRIHAKLFAQQDGIVFITDLSKYGTFVNNRRLTKDQRCELKEGDLIKFGNQPNKSEFRLLKTQLVFCCSNMNASQKTEAKKSASKLGGAVVDNWNSSCTHLIMTSIVVTVKAVNALSSIKPIVTPKWLEDCVMAIKSGLSIPDHADYLPEVIDQNCKESKACFLPDESRSFLLSGKVFYFLTEKQYKRLHECVNNSGGVCRLATSQENLSNLDELVDSNSIVMSVDSNTLSSLDHVRKEWVEQVLSFIKSKGYRSVVDSEIGLALLRVSTETDCNPLSHQALEPLPPPTLSQQGDNGPPTAGNSLSNVTVYANETLFGSEPSGLLNDTHSTPKIKNPLTACKSPIKEEVKEEEDEISVSLSVPAGNIDLIQSANDRTTYFESQESPVRVDHMSSTPAVAKEEMIPAISSPDGLSCSPSTFHSLLPAASTSVLIPGTFTQKSNKEKDVKAMSNFFSSRKRKKQTESELADDNVIDLTIDSAPPPKPSTTSAGVNIFNILSAKRKKKEEAARNKASGSSSSIKSRTNVEVQHNGDSSNGKDKAVADLGATEVPPVSRSTSDDRSSSRVLNVENSSFNDSALQEPMDDNTDSQRPVLSRFKRFSRKKRGGFISARVRKSVTDDIESQREIAADLHDNVILPVAPAVLCEQVSLVVCRVAEAALDNLAIEVTVSGIKNFKKFKKARYVGIGALPTIIGGSGLAYYDGEMTSLTQEWHREREEELQAYTREEDPDLFELPGRRK